ncbi:hypothetical protein SAMN04488519_103150 [Algoriphagus ornithinivorans]|uniref:Uncharacterized protein n=1 Tax=Algoriphagus ornithinivorans TaxID=226506 RepID=A0A1I5DU15_9BACT|nr:hypothetical protein [Algoriphagus ornithinivorans]SFO02752.1 hypothetical protein SAMN04488519_103150 [Algoriphagus ornithinivorans]
MQRFIWEEIISSYCFDETASILAVTPLFMTHESSKLPTLSAYCFLHLLFFAGEISPAKWQRSKEIIQAKANPVGI